MPTDFDLESAVPCTAEPSINRERDANEIVRSLYKASAGLKRQDEFLAELARCVSSRHAFWHVHSLETFGGILASHNVGPLMLADYALLSNEQNLWTAAALHRRTDMVWRSSQATITSEAKREAPFSRFTKSHNIGDSLHITAVAGGERSHLILIRSADEENFGDAELEIAQLLHFHLQTSAEISGIIARTWNSETALAEISGATGLGAVIIKGTQLAFATVTGRKMLLALGARLGGIENTTYHYSNERIHLPRAVSEAIERSESNGTTTALLSEFRGDRRYVMQVRAIRPKDSTCDTEQRFLLIVYDPDERIPSNDEILRLIYELTAGEARVSCLLAEGRSIEEIAEYLDVSLHTVRAHLKRAFEKTGVSRQAELVKTVLNCDRMPSDKIKPYVSRLAKSIALKKPAQRRLAQLAASITTS